MANIKSYIDQIRNAVFGEEVRSSIINALNLVNTDNEKYLADRQAIKNDRDYVEQRVINFDKRLEQTNQLKNDLNAAVDGAEKVKQTAQEALKDADANILLLKDSTKVGVETKTQLDASNQAATQTNGLLQTQNTTAASNLAALKSENFKSNEILTGVQDIKDYLGYSDNEVVGLEVDFENKSNKRVAGAYNLTAGADFDKFQMYGDRKKCNVADDGTINAFYGEPTYVEDGSNGQVMVYQPAFFYRVVPVKIEKQSDGLGYHLRKANYYVSSQPRPGFKLHPAFIDANGDELEYILLSAYEGSIYDTSASNYLADDEQVMDVSTDLFSSIAGVRPASGWKQSLTRTNIEAMAKKRGVDWHSDNIKTKSMEQLLMLIELGTLNFQSAIGNGVVSLPWETLPDKACSYAAKTGSTASFGNGTGQASSTVTYPGGTATPETANGKTSIVYRGRENFYGNIYKFAVGISMYGDGHMKGGQPFICSDFNYQESKNTGNYVGAGFTATNKVGYVSAFGYSEEFDWLFIASETDGNSSVPVGDYTYTTENLNGYRIARLGGSWSFGSYAGGFSWSLDSGVGSRHRTIGGRLVYVPTKQSAVAYLTNIEKWRQSK